MDPEENAPVTPAADPSTNPTPDATPAGDDEEAEESGSTTPEEVAQILKLPLGTDEETPEETPEEAPEETPETPETPAETPEEAPAAPEPPKPAEPAKPAEAVPTDEDAPQFTIEVEDANGVTHKIGVDDRLDDVLRDFDPKNNGQILQILSDLQDLKQQKATYDKEQTAKTEAAAQESRIEALQQGWDKEIADLQTDNRLGEFKADGSNERVNQVYAFMDEENDRRIADGKALLQSFEDALDKLENQEARAAKAKAAEDAKTTSRKNGAMVGGSSAPSGSGQPAYRAGSASNANQALRSIGLLK